MIYLANPVRQFNDFTAKATNLDEVSGIYMSEKQLKDSGFNEGDNVKVVSKYAEITASIISDNKISGNIVVIPNFDSKLNSEALFSGYRFNSASIERV
jgi:NADH-quinone oxidoreductase subunit G